MPSPHEKELNDLEKLLAALTPRPATLDRDRLLFRAGQQSMRPGWTWPAAAVLMSATSGALAMLLLLRPVPEPVVRIVHVPLPPVSGAALVDPPGPTAPAGAGEYRPAPLPNLTYWQMRQQALRFGEDGLPPGVADGGETSVSEATLGPDLSAGSRPRLFNRSALYSHGEP